MCRGYRGREPPGPECIPVGVEIGRRLIQTTLTATWADHEPPLRTIQPHPRNDWIVIGRIDIRHVDAIDLERAAYKDIVDPSCTGSSGEIRRERGTRIDEAGCQRRGDDVCIRMCVEVAAQDRRRSVREIEELGYLLKAGGARFGRVVEVR